MAHLTVRSGYEKFVTRLNQAPQGVVPSKTLYHILEILLDQREAELISQLPMRPFTVKMAARIWQVKEAAAQRDLDTLAGKAILLDFRSRGQQLYLLPPPMAGFFEFSLMRVRDDIDQKVLSELFYKYITVEDEFIKNLLVNGETQLGRAFVQEAAITDGLSLHVMDYEKASHVIATSSSIGVGLCYCRHKMKHLDRACSAPLDICMTFNVIAESLIKHGFARSVSASECLDLLSQAYAHNLVQFGENVREKVTFICNCCGCCCEAMIAARKFAFLSPVHTTNFIVASSPLSCKGCGKCVAACPVEAIALVSANDPHRPKRKKTKLDEEICLGCGVCVRVCPTRSLQMKLRAQRVITPVNSAHRTVLMAIERGKLQYLLLDALTNHRAVAAILGAILKLPPLKQAMASRQMKSRYLEALLAPYGRHVPKLLLR